MPVQLQIFLVISSFITLAMIIKAVRKSKLSSDMAVIWIVWGIGLIMISIFPQIVYCCATLLHISSSVNAIFLVVIYLLYIITFYLYSRVSLLETKVKKLVQYIAIHEHDEELETEKKDS